PGPVLLQRLHGRAHFLDGRLAEVGQPDVADAAGLVVDEVPLLGVVLLAPVAQHALHVDLVADDGDVHDLLGALVDDAQDDLLSGVALDQIDRLAEAHVLGGLAVDLDDGVAGQDAGVVGGGADHGADDHQVAAVLAVVADLDADAAELALAL